MPKRLRFSARAAYAHLREADPVIGALIEEHGPYQPRPGGDPYGSLVRSIMFQQLAGPAARTIQRRFFALYGPAGYPGIRRRDEERTPTPLAILATTDEAFRGAGVSRQKAGYLRDLAQHSVDGTLEFSGIDRLDDDEVTERLTAVKGIGEWSAHMFLMFELGRPDVLPVGDLGVRKGMQAAYGLGEAPTPTRALAIGEPWAPFRSVGAWYMWRAASTITQDDQAKGDQAKGDQAKGDQAKGD